MSKKNGLSALAIAQKLQSKKEFTVKTNRERKSALTASKYLGIPIITRAIEGGGFEIKFVAQ